MAEVYLSPLSRQVVGDLVQLAKLSCKTSSPDEFLDLFAEALMMEWNAQLAQMHQRAGTSHRPRRARAAKPVQGGIAGAVAEIAGTR